MLISDHICMSDINSRKKKKRTIQKRWTRKPLKDCRENCSRSTCRSGAERTAAPLKPILASRLAQMIGIPDLGSRNNFCCWPSVNSPFRLFTLLAFCCCCCCFGRIYQPAATNEIHMQRTEGHADFFSKKTSASWKDELSPIPIRRAWPSVNWPFPRNFPNNNERKGGRDWKKAK